MRLLALILLMPAALPQQKPDIDHANTFDRLCGKLVHSEPRPIKGKFYRGSMQQSSVGNAELRLYPRREDGICCQNLSLAGKTSSDELGQFEFKKIGSGAYWMVTEFNGHEYKMPIRYQFASVPKDQCADFRFEVSDSGSFELGRVIAPSQ